MLTLPSPNDPDRDSIATGWCCLVWLKHASFQWQLACPHSTGTSFRGGSANCLRFSISSVGHAWWYQQWGKAAISSSLAERHFENMNKGGSVAHKALLTSFFLSKTRKAQPLEALMGLKCLHRLPESRTKGGITSEIIDVARLNLAAPRRVRTGNEIPGVVQLLPIWPQVFGLSSIDL